MNFPKYLGPCQIAITRDGKTVECTGSLYDWCIDNGQTKMYPAAYEALCQTGKYVIGDVTLLSHDED